MKCLYCDNPATVHLTDIVNQKKQQTHLCERCARERNLLPGPPGPQINLQALMKLLVAPLRQSERDATCPACGLSYAAFKAEGRLGCPHDYDAFRPALEPILERIHRATAHAGKLPAARRAGELDELRARMQAAAAAEDYEEAARLRDLIRQRQAEGTPG